MLTTLLTTLYVTCALLLTAYAISQTVLLALYWLHRRDTHTPPHTAALPSVTVQLPMYNERTVVARLLDACARLDYPRDRLTIQVLDDSSDDTQTIAAERCAYWRAQGVNIQHIRRADRRGYKAGALAYGMTISDSELFAVLDADFVPDRDFLKRTVPFFAGDPLLGMVQTRWGHLNPFDNPLTLGQALSVDAHFVVEQTARNRAGMLMNFNGSAGIWRASCIHEAGGWDDATLSEDLDLSYRAQLAGWHFLYLPDVVVPAELPPQMTAYKLQQARWAKGSTQVLIRMLGKVWRAPRLTLPQRLIATLHLCQYLPHPLMVLLLLLTPPMILTGAFAHLPLGSLSLAGLGPMLIFVVSQQALYRDWTRRLFVLPILIAFGTGIAWNNTRAVLGGIFSKRSEFKRTPKVGQDKAGGYTLAIDEATWFELGLAAYAFWGVTEALKLYPALVPYLGLYSFAFFAIALWSLGDALIAAPAAS